MPSTPCKSGHGSAAIYTWDAGDSGYRLIQHAGGEYGYALLWMVTLSTLMLIILQHNAAHLGIVTGLCLAEAATLHMRRSASRALLSTAGLASVSTSLAEILGGAIALDMLFGIPVRIGALLVMEGETIVGIVTERDYARKVALLSRSSKDTAVSEIMTTAVMYVHPKQTNAECMALMTDKRIRHLPVVSDGAVQGLVSIGDLVNATMAEQEFLISQLGSYISGDLT